VIIKIFRESKNMARNGSRTRRQVAEDAAKVAAQAAAAATLEALDHDEDEDEDEMEESIQPGDDGRPKTQKGRNAPSAGGPSKDVKLGSEGPDAIAKSRVQEAHEDEEEEDDDEKSESRNPLGRHLDVREAQHNDDEEEDDDDMKEGKADDQLTRTDDSSRSDAQRKRTSPVWSGDIGNEITADSNPAIPAGTAVVETQMAGEGAKSQTQNNPGRPEDQLTDADNDTGSDASRAGQRGGPGTGGKPSSGALDSAQTAKEKPIDPSAVGMDKTVAEATNALFNGEDLTEDFKTKAKTVFGAALREVMNRHSVAMTERYNGFLDEKVVELQANFDQKQAEIVERVDDYLGYVVEQWLGENKLAVENGLRAEITDSFMKGLHGLFQEHHIELPEDRVDAYTESQTRVSDLENQLKEQINSNVQLRKELSSKTVNEAFDEVADGLADTDRERLRSLAEGVEFGDEAEFKSKVTILRESYFGGDRPNPEVEEVDEINEPAAPQLGKSMAANVTALGRLAGHPTPTSKFRQAQLNG
jgi:hypothetical protein